MGRETRVWMPKSQSKAGMGIAYGQRNESVDGEKSVQSRHGDSIWAEITGERDKKVSLNYVEHGVWAEKND